MEQLMSPGGAASGPVPWKTMVAGDPRRNLDAAPPGLADYVSGSFSHGFAVGPNAA